METRSTGRDRDLMTDRHAPAPTGHTVQLQHGIAPSAYLLLLLMGIAWGLSLSLAKLASTHGGHPIGLALWQVCISGLLMLTVSIATRGPPPLRPDVVRFSFFCGGVGVAFPAMALFWSATHLPAGVVAIAFASMPLFTYTFSVVFGVERGEGRRLLGVAVGLGAMALLVLPDEALPGPGLAPWVLLALLASVSMSVENFYAAGFRPAAVSSVQLSCGRQLGAVVLLAPIALLTQTTLPVFVSWGAAQWAATGTGVLSGVAFTVLLYVIRTSGPVFASQSAYIITLAGVAWGMLLFAERHSVYIWSALALTLLGIALVKPQKPKTLVQRREILTEKA